MVYELKTRLRKVLYMWQIKRDSKKFSEFEDLIMNFDQGDDYKIKFEEEMKKKRIGYYRPSNKEILAVAGKNEVPLGIVNEDDEEDLEMST